MRAGTFLPEKRYAHFPICAIPFYGLWRVNCSYRVALQTVL
jgi:hypothetical protein